MSSPWVITRPREEAERDVAALLARGVPALALPVLERVALPWSAERPDLLILSSASVIEAVRAAWAGWSPAPKVAAMAPETADQARAAGLPVHVEAPGGAQALAEAVRAAWERLDRPARALYPTSLAGLDSPEQRAAVAHLETNIQVGRVAVLDLRRPADLDARLEAAPPGARWVLASPSAARSLFECRSLPPAAAVLCHGASTRAACGSGYPAGWPAPTLGRGARVLETVLDAEARPLSASFLENR